MKRAASFTVSVLFKKEGVEWIGHCLELDIVQTGTNLKTLKADMKNLIITQVSYAFKNNNLDHLFSPAPAEVWKEFFDCKKMDEAKYRLKVSKKNAGVVPPWVIANICKSETSSCHAA